jgi:hypothetical protein
MSSFNMSLSNWTWSAGAQKVFIQYASYDHSGQAIIGKFIRHDCSPAPVIISKHYQENI